MRAQRMQRDTQLGPLSEEGPPKELHSEAHRREAPGRLGAPQPHRPFIPAKKWPAAASTPMGGLRLHSHSNRMEGWRDSEGYKGRKREFSLLIWPVWEGGVG